MESIWEAVSIYHTSVVDSFQKQGFWAKFAAVGLMLYVSTKLWRRYNRKSIKGEITLITGKYFFYFY